MKKVLAGVSYKKNSTIERFLVKKIKWTEFIAVFNYGCLLPPQSCQFKRRFAQNETF
ncbi:hypothetical protein Cabys_2917 [Caldithrix abyssi DSM 13497]|uniref:Uncharacterized protein n=1 Tax=Caldithrix abyssi DSM 13497 TaxID=880073 RepID=A0A1J1CBM3_CALAY|nr:hypothetical protein Cabys_2917 [Caldithrix abyssi DSM 13497]